ncbi:MAG TPA: hypothetical protein VNY05_46200, partial [Candidatus Acidoferrales bacterium]|nr:hypothetical protein [Candidatus Acidoferrales bacterium]
MSKFGCAPTPGGRIANPPQVNNLPHKQSARVARVHTGEELGRVSVGEIIQQSHFWTLVLSITCSEFL